MPTARQQKRPRVTLYGTRQCGHCRRAKAFLARHRVPFAEFDITASRRAARAFELAGGRSVPLIVIGDRSVAGFDPEQLARALRGAGFEL